MYKISYEIQHIEPGSTRVLDTSFYRDTCYTALSIGDAYSAIERLFDDMYPAREIKRITFITCEYIVDGHVLT